MLHTHCSEPLKTMMHILAKNFFFDHVNEKSTSKVLRENRGDLFVGLLYTMEASGPFVAIRHLLLLTNKAWYFPDR